MADLRDDVRAAFRQRFGRKPVGVWSAPGVVTLIGELTGPGDGLALSFALDRRTLVAAGQRDDATLRIASTFDDEDTLYLEVELAALAELQALQADEIESALGWGAYPAGVAWALGGVDLTKMAGLDLMFDSNVPVGAGLSSSAAIECAAALALVELWQLDLSADEVAEACRHAESDFVRAPSGLADQAASMLGRRDTAVLLDGRSGDTEIVPLGFADVELQLLAIDTGVGHAPNLRSERLASCEKAALLMHVESLRDLTADDLARAEKLLTDTTFKRMRHVVTENQRVLDAVAALRAGDPAALGPVFDASHRSMRDDFETSAPELDLAVELAQANGAIGARGSGGGTVIALVPTGDVSRVQVALDGGFAEHGYGQPETFTVAASDGAARDGG